MGTLSIYESLSGLGDADTVSASLSPLAPWAGAAQIFQKREDTKSIKQQRKLVSAQTEQIKASEATTAAEYKRVTEWENRKQELRISVGRKAERVRYDAAIAAKLYDKIVGKLEAYSLVGKFGGELDSISKAVTAGLIEVSTVNLNTADLDQLGSLDVEIDTAQWVVTEGRARLARLNDRIDDEVKAIEARRQDQERASRREAQALEQAAKDAQLEEERAEFYAASARKTAELKLWVQLKDEIRRERRLLEQDLAKLASLERSMS